MSINSINTNIAAYSAQRNIGTASSSAGSSIARLSSGNRIVRASDDVAALSAGTSLRTNVSTLRVALINSSQGSSLLQVADGALAQITDILQRQNAIAVQAGSGTLTSSERSFLNQEFQNLSSEIDRLATQTNFNGVNLLDGAFEASKLDDATTGAKQAFGALRFTAYATANTVIINGITITGTDGAATAEVIGTSLTFGTVAGDSIATRVQRLATALNASNDRALNGASYVAVNDTLEIRSRAGGLASQSFRFATTGTSTTVASGRLTNTANTFSLEAANDVGVGSGDISVSGTVGDSLLAAQNAARGNVTLNFSNTSENFDGKTIKISNGVAGNFITFEFDNNASVTETAALRALTIPAFATAAVPTAAERAAALDVAVGVINSYAETNVNTNFYTLAQIRARRDGDNIVIERTDVGNATITTGVALADAIASTSTNVTTTGSTTLQNGSTQGVVTTGVRNAGFVGTVQGFKGTFNSTNSVTFDLTVGDSTYRAANVNVTNGTTATPSVIRFTSEDGDYFDISYIGTGITAANQNDADTLALRLDRAFSTLQFNQSRDIQNFAGIGRASLNRGSFGDNVVLDDIKVAEPVTGSTNGKLTFVVDGVNYVSAANIGTQLGANGIYRFTSEANATEYLEIRVGAATVQFSTSTQAAALEAQLKAGFGFEANGAPLAFQVGVSASDSLDVSFGAANTDTIFSGQTLDVLTQEAASTAVEVIQAAIDKVTSVRAEVGGLQSRFNFASANVQSSLQNQDAARGVLLDTDVAAESTAYATAQVQLQAGIAVLAQANQLPQNLLKLIG
jgi:flagellin